MKNIKIVFVALILVVGVNYLLAAPPANPPSGDVSGIIDISNTFQSKGYDCKSSSGGCVTLLDIDDQSNGGNETFSATNLLVWKDLITNLVGGYTQLKTIGASSEVCGVPETIAGIQTVKLVTCIPNQITPAPTGPVCGNSIVETGEQCDDGNTLNGDGCSSTCQTEVAPPAVSGLNVNSVCSQNNDCALDYSVSIDAPARAGGETMEINYSYDLCSTSGGCTFGGVGGTNSYSTTITIPAGSQTDSGVLSSTGGAGEYNNVSACIPPSTSSATVSPPWSC